MIDQCTGHIANRHSLGLLAVTLTFLAVGIDKRIGLMVRHRRGHCHLDRAVLRDGVRRLSRWRRLQARCDTRCHHRMARDCDCDVVTARSPGRLHHRRRLLRLDVPGQ